VYLSSVHIHLQSSYLPNILLPLLICSNILYLFNFGLTSTFSNMNIATAAFFQIPFTWYIALHPLSVCECLYQWEIVSYRRQTVEFGFLIESSSLHLLLRVLRLLTFRVIIESYLLIPVLFHDWFICSFLPFVLIFSHIHLRSLLYYWVEHVWFFPSSHVFIYFFF
jgi:hypothetical protein